MYGSALLCVASLLVPLTRSTAGAFLLIGIAMFADNLLSANMFASMTDLFDEQQVGRVTGFSGLASGLFSPPDLLKLRTGKATGSPVRRPIPFGISWRKAPMLNQAIAAPSSK